MKIYKLINAYRFGYMAEPEKDKIALEKLKEELNNCTFKNLEENVPMLTIGSRERTILEVLIQEGLVDLIPKKAMQGISIKTWLVKPPGREQLLKAALKQTDVYFKLNQEAINQLPKILKLNEETLDINSKRRLRILIKKIEKFQKLKTEETIEVS